MSPPLKLSDALSKDELSSLRRKSDFKAAVTLLWTWGLIVAAFAIAIAWTNPFTIILGIVILGGRQLGLGIINHDCAHSAFFKNKAVNEFAGQWLAAVPINSSLAGYRAYHLEHHKHAGTEKDPDLIFVKNYPVSSESLKRKFMRDLTGQTGFRDTKRKLQNLSLKRNKGSVAFHILMLAALTGAGAPWAYLMWWAAEIFVYPAVVRLRQIGQHGTAKDRSSSDPRLNTGTTIAPWWQKILIAPNNVNYHLEHHYLASIPPYNLKRLHGILSKRGFYDGFDCISYGYGDVLRRAVRKDSPANTLLPAE